MERDFMGLSTKVKQEEDPEKITDSARVQSSKMQWTFSNKGSAQQFLSLDSSKNEKPKTGFEALASNGLVSITTTESTDTSRNPFSNIMQKQGGNHYTGSTNTPILPVSTSVPGKSTSNPVVGTTELRNSSRTSGAPAQLTIFYAGSVCVYEDISPEKAQAIMLLARNESSLNSNAAITTSPTQMPTVRPNLFAENHNHVAIPCFTSAVSVTSISSYDDAAAVRTIRPKAVDSTRSIPPTVLSSASDVPQFRKASLARFLEKRKERVSSAASPYSNDSKQSKECNNIGSSNNTGRMPVNSSGSCPLPAAS